MNRVNWFFVCCLLIGYSVANGQSVNLVPNPSFELKNACPTGTSTSNYGILTSQGYNYFPVLQSWVSPLRTTADYFNSCATLASGVSVPLNSIGSITAHSGNAYVGGYMTAQGHYDFREYVEAKLNQKMIAGHQYYVSFYTARAGGGMFHQTNYDEFAFDMIGALFTDTILYSNNFNLFNIMTPASVVNTKGRFITDTDKWTKVEGTYTAKGTEQWITLGHFADPMPSSAILVKKRPVPSAQDSECYMYFDDVSVIDMTTTSDAHVYDTNICAASFPLTLTAADTGTKYFWNTGDTTATISVKDSGTYWRGTFGEMVYYTDTFKIHTIPTPDLNIGKDSTYCPGSTVLLLANHPYSHYLWNTGDTTLFLVVKKKGQYILKVTDPCRAQLDTINISFAGTQPPLVADTAFCLHTVDPLINVAGDSIKWYTVGSEVGALQQPVINTDVVDSTTLYVTQTQRCGESLREAVHIGIVILPSIAIDVQNDTVICSHVTVSLKAISSNNQYLWSTGDRTSNINVVNTGTYTVATTNVCGTVTDSVHITFKSCVDCIWLPDAFTPNGDGKNDVFRPSIKKECVVKSFEIHIYDRWGRLVYLGTDLTQGWDGTYNGTPCDMATYMYTVKFAGMLDEQEQELKGDLTLIR